MRANKREKRSNPRRKRWIFKGVQMGCILLVVLSLALFNRYLPFRSLLPALALEPRAEGELSLHFLSVGQADCAIVEYPDGSLLFIDGGDGSWASRNHIISYAKGLNIQSAPQINYLVTHADGDHYGGLYELITLFGGDTLYLPIEGTEQTDYQTLLSVAESKGLERVTLTRYQSIAHESGAMFSCISPVAGQAGSGNDLSTALYLEYEGKRALFCGDISAERESVLLTEYLTDESIFNGANDSVQLREIDLLKVAHHGSANSSSQEWLNLLCAKNAVISCGAGNGYNHPRVEVSERLKEARADCEIYRTDELGDIVVRMDKNQVAVSYGSGE